MSDATSALSVPVARPARRGSQIAKTWRESRAAYMLLAPFLRKVARLQPWTPRTIEAPLSRRINSVADRHQFYTVRIEDGKADPAFKASGDITSLANADGYIEIEAGVSSVEAGQRVRVTLF